MDPSIVPLAIPIKRNFPVLCAWCEAEGKMTVLNWIGVKGSHGICPVHARKMIQNFYSQRDVEVKK
jgi:hypothetical protein